MKIFVKIKPNSKRERVEKIDKNCFKVWVKEPAKEGKANKSMHRILAESLQNGFTGTLSNLLKK